MAAHLHPEGKEARRGKGESGGIRNSPNQSQPSPHRCEAGAKAWQHVVDRSYHGCKRHHLSKFILPHPRAKACNRIIGL